MLTNLIRHSSQSVNVLSETRDFCWEDLGNFRNATRCKPYYSAFRWRPDVRRCQVILTLNMDFLSSDCIMDYIPMHLFPEQLPISSFFVIMKVFKEMARKVKGRETIGRRRFDG